MELVLAKFKKDNLWYRAKILNVFDDETVKVILNYISFDIFSVIQQQLKL